MTNAPLLIHVGYHKTATSWLQNAVFRPEHGFNWVLTHDETFAHVVHPHGLAFDPQNVAGLITEHRKQGRTGSVDVISLEALVGHPFFGGRESEAYAERLKNFAPEARILITIREQVGMIASVYMQYLRRGGALAPETFFAGENVGGYFGFDPAQFEYDRLVAYYQELFGADRVLVLPMERIAAYQAGAVERIAEFAGNTAIAPWEAQPARGIGAPEAMAWLLRRINHLQSGPAHRQPIADLGQVARLAYRTAERLGKELKLTRRPVTDLARARYDGRYIDSNRRLATLVSDTEGLDVYQGLGAPKSSDEISYKEDYVN